MSASIINNLQLQIIDLQQQLTEANDTLEAIRTGQVDALIVHDGEAHQLFSLTSADHSYRVFIEKMNEGAVSLNKDHLIVYCNEAFANLVGYSSAKIIGYSFKNFVDESCIEIYDRSFTNSHIADSKCEIELNGTSHKISVLMSLTALRDADQETINIVLTDLTLQKNTQQQLQQNLAALEESNKLLERSNTDLQQFASVASHDLQEPVRKIQIFSGMLKDHDHLDAVSDTYVDKIIATSHRMKMLIVNMLEYSKLSSDTADTTTVNLDTIVNHVLEDIEMIIADKGAVINKQQLPVIPGNAGQMRQLFQNIISNGLKFMPGGKSPVIHITTKQIAAKSFDAAEENGGPFWLISIKDNGIGFHEKYMDNIFKLFERLNSKDAFEGTGIGLAITKKIIEKHNGLITAKSSEGEGAEFIFVLPAY